MTLSSRLLSVFIRTPETGTRFKSPIIRYQALSIIFLNFSLLLMAILYESTVWLLFHGPNAAFLTTCCIPCVTISLLFLSQGHLDIAGSILILSMHFVNYCAGHIAGAPMVGALGLLALPSFVNFAVTSSKFLIANSLLCLVQYVLHVRELERIFRITLTDEQSTQMTVGLISLLILLVTFCCLSLGQKLTENSLWKNAQTDYTKSENLTKEIVQTVELKEVFLSSLSAEVKNALNSLKDSLDYLVKVMKDQEHIKALNNAKLSGEILLNLVNNVLDASKVKSGKIELLYRPASLEEIFKKVFEIHAKSLAKSSLNVEAFIDKNLPQNIWVDSEKILQILMNLFSNAVKFSPFGGKIRIDVAWCEVSVCREDLLAVVKKNEIKKEGNGSEQYRMMSLQLNNKQESENLPTEEFSLEETAQKEMNFELLKETVCSSSLLNENSRWSIQKIEMPSQRTLSSVASEYLDSRKPSHKKGYLKIQVSDNGQGIPQEEIATLFDLYNKPHLNRRPNQGTGLGLWITKQLCQKMGGDIAVESKVNCGTSFVFYIHVNNERITSLDFLPMKKPAREQVNALVVDDYLFNRNLHKLLLEKEGVQVVLACDGKEAVEKYKEKGEDYFDFVMMDVQMPEMNGFQAAEEMRKWENDKQFKNTDIYFVSGEYFNEEEVMMGFQTNIGSNKISGIRCLRKPIDLDLVGNIVRKYNKKPQ